MPVKKPPFLKKIHGVTWYYESSMKSTHLKRVLVHSKIQHYRYTYQVLSGSGSEIHVMFLYLKHSDHKVERKSILYLKKVWQLEIRVGVWDNQLLRSLFSNINIIVSFNTQKTWYENITVIEGKRMLLT